jgi:hypothetical protein
MTGWHFSSAARVAERPMLKGLLCHGDGLAGFDEVSM